MFRVTQTYDEARLEDKRAMCEILSISRALQMSFEKGKDQAYVFIDVSVYSCLLSENNPPQIRGVTGIKGKPESVIYSSCGTHILYLMVLTDLCVYVCRQTDLKLERLSNKLVNVGSRSAGTYFCFKDVWGHHTRDTFHLYCNLEPLFTREMSREHIDSHVVLYMREKRAPSTLTFNAQCPPRFYELGCSSPVLEDPSVTSASLTFSRRETSSWLGNIFGYAPGPATFVIRLVVASGEKKSTFFINGDACGRLRLVRQ